VTTLRRRRTIIAAFLVLGAGAVAAILLPGDRERTSGSSTGTTYRLTPDTVERLRGLRLRPGDRVLFQGGATFDAELRLTASGTARAPIVYGSYGEGRARFTRSVFLDGADRVTIQDLELTGAEQGIASLGSRDTGARGVTIRRNAIRDTGIAVHSAHPGDADWVIADNAIERTRDSAVIVVGERARVDGNTIVDAGFDASIPYGRHGIYLKGAHGTVTGNRIRGFPGGSAVSVRRHDSRVRDNEIERGLVGISWFQEDAGAGTSRWRDNRISGTTDAGIYVSPSDAAGATRESFEIAGNVISIAGGRHLNLAPTTGRYTVARNVLR
jgi:hypothetical protein